VTPADLDRMQEAISATVDRRRPSLVTPEEALAAEMDLLREAS
jgi:hypothetical protein